MATHSMHADVHEHGLADDCPRCEELAERPLELDDEMFAGSWKRMMLVEYGGNDAAYPTANEARLGKTLYEWSLFLERHTPITPAQLLTYLHRLAA